MHILDSLHVLWDNNSVLSLCEDFSGNHTSNFPSYEPVVDVVRAAPGLGVRGKSLQNLVYRLSHIHLESLRPRVLR